MIRYIILVLLLIFGILGWMYFSIGTSTIYRETLPELTAPHKFDDPATPISSIHITAFYFVPKNKESAIIQNWRELLDENLKKLQAFHALQFQGRSKIEYTVYPVPVIGLKNNLEYDTEVTQYGNPEALQSIAAELEARVFNTTGDLHHPGFGKTTKGAYSVSIILYEGVGASGTADGVALISRKFLSNPEYRETAATILAHEFYHTLGIPDGYEREHANPTTKDIMGLGRISSPIEKTYIERETLGALGL